MCVIPHTSFTVLLTRRLMFDFDLSKERSFRMHMPALMNKV